LILFSVTVIHNSKLEASKEEISICRIHYQGGGDWYNDRSIIPNLLKKFESVTGISCEKEQRVSSLEDNKIFQSVFLFITGHGNMVFNDIEIRNLRKHLLNGGFCFIDDDYGLDASVRREVKKIFPEKEFVQVPFTHKVYHSFYHFSNGLPKTHAHDEKKPEGWGIFHDGRLILFYAYESNISDGWADPSVHKDPPEKREEALKMGINLLYYSLIE